MKLNSLIRSDLSISFIYILFRSIMFFLTKSCWKTTIFFSILVNSWAMLHIPRYISSSRLRLRNFFIPFERPYAGEAFDINSSAGSLCVFPGEHLKRAFVYLFLNVFLFHNQCIYVHCFYCYASVSSQIDLPAAFLAALVQLNLRILSNTRATFL